MEELLFRKLHLWSAQQASVRLHRRETESQTAQLSGRSVRLTDAWNIVQAADHGTRASERLTPRRVSSGGRVAGLVLSRGHRLAGGTRGRPARVPRQPQPEPRLRSETGGTREHTCGTVFGLFSLRGCSETWRSCENACFTMHRFQQERLANVCLLGCVGVSWTLSTRTPFGLSGHVGCQATRASCSLLSMTQSTPKPAPKVPQMH